jgi:hypothetical protein
MKPMLAAVVLTGLSVTANAALLPGDSAKGKALHEKQCTACHDSSVYTRGNRRVQSVEGLIGQVNMCERQIGIRLNRDQVNDLVKYLDEAYYKFK